MVFDERHLSYRDLNNRSNQLARHLRKLGVGPEVLVVFYPYRSPEMIVGLLGIFKKLEALMYRSTPVTRLSALHLS